MDNIYFYSAGINFSTLENAISDAQELHDNAELGTDPGKYPIGSKALLQAAIDDAKAVADNADATQTEVNAAVITLTEAIKTFEEKMKLPASPAPATNATEVGAVFYNSGGEYSSRPQIGNINYNPGWGAPGVQATQNIGGKEVLKISNLGWIGITYDSVDASVYSTLHFDYLAPKGNKMLIKVVSEIGDMPEKELHFWNQSDSVPPFVTGEWVSVDIDLTTDLTADKLASLTQLVIDTNASDPKAPVVFFDNIYFH